MAKSKELQALLQYAVDSGVPHRVTSTTGGQHAASSLHYQAGTEGLGRAADFAGPVADQDGSPEMLAIFNVFHLVAPQIRELFYTGPGGGLLKYGVPFSSPQLEASHKNHCHVGVDRGVILQFPFPKEPTMPDDPNRPNIKGPVKFQFFTDPATGICTGYFIYNEFGELHSYGPAAVFFGVSEVVQ